MNYVAIRSVVESHARSVVDNHEADGDCITHVVSCVNDVFVDVYVDWLVATGETNEQISIKQSSKYRIVYDLRSPVESDPWGRI